MSMKELSIKFLSLLRYVPYIIDENLKIQLFLRCFSTRFKNIIEFDNPKTLEEKMRKANFSYEQCKNREIIPNQKNKRESNFDHKRKYFKPNKSFENNSQNFSKNNYQGKYFKSKTQQNITAPKYRDMPNNYVKNNEHKEPVKCWECQGPHYEKDCPNKRSNYINVDTI